MIDLILQKGESLLYLLVTLVLGWIGWSVKTRFVPREDHNKLENDHRHLAMRVTQLESAIGNLPSAKEINALRAQLSDVGTELKVFNQRQINAEDNMRRVQTQLDRMDMYLRGPKGGQTG